MASSVKDITSLKQKAANLFSRGLEWKFWIYRLKWNYFQRYKIVPSAPLHADIEVTDSCNLRCVMCIHGLEGVQDTGFISPALAYKAIDECAEIGVYSIKFNFRGEPLLHPNIVDFVKYAKERGILEVQFNSNGLPANEKKIEALINAGLDRIIFSVDGATAETYEKIRIGGNYEKLIRNIDTFLRIKKERDLVKPFIRVQMVKYFGADKEVDQFIDFWSGKGVDNISVIKKQDRSNKCGQPLKNGVSPVGRAFCEQPWQRININRDGKVLMCCGDWDRKNIIGDFNNQTIKELWHSKKLTAIRNKIRKLDLDNIAACKSCFRPTTYRWE